MNRVNKAMILAAGFGERARPLSLVRPKPLFPVLGRPLIAYTLDWLAENGLKEVVVNTHHLAARLEQYLAGLEPGLNIRILREEKILGTGGGMKNAEFFLGPEPFVIINGDILTDLDLAPVIAAHLAHRPPATLVLHDCSPFNNVAVDQDGLIRGFRGRWSGPDRILAYTGVQIVEPEVLGRIPAGFSDFIDTYQRLIGDGRPPGAYIADGLTWREVGTPGSYLGLHAELLQRRPEGPVLVAPGARVSSGAVIEGWAGLSDGAVVESGAYIKDAVLWPGARAAAGVRVVGSVLADGAVARRDLWGEFLIEADESKAALR